MRFSSVFLFLVIIPLLGFLIANTFLSRPYLISVLLATCCVSVAFPYLLIHGDRILGRLNPFWPEGFHHSPFGITGIDAGILENYFLLSINLLIPGVVIKFSIWLRTEQTQSPFLHGYYCQRLFICLRLSVIEFFCL